MAVLRGDQASEAWVVRRCVRSLIFVEGELAPGATLRSIRPSCAQDTIVTGVPESFLIYSGDAPEQATAAKARNMSVSARGTPPR